MRLLQEGELTHDVQVGQLVPHGVRVHLAHVPALVGLLDVLDAEHPVPFLRVRDAHAVVLRDDVALDGQDGLGVHTQPRHLQREMERGTLGETRAPGRSSSRD
jgi:hypothetical protein